ncbi:aminoglycoside phosphotransferase family protein [Kribbella sp. NBC_00382]|uniref:aminoglycoside phosphotransferase family protein n=1 Tax=Kribbella sp. NBC_00382 TaxID=2975967 RepID=UPI002E250597
MIVVPAEFTRTTVAREGEACTPWLDALPSLVAELLERWNCEPDGAVMFGGVGIIVPVLRRGAGPAVLKVSFPHPGNLYEPDAFATWQGRGAVELYERDDEHFAMLLERAHPVTLASLTDEDEIAEVAGRLSQRLAVPAPAVLPRLQAQADSWEEELERDARELDHGLPVAALDAARSTIQELARKQPNLVIHGDFHGKNILRSDREPWLAVDPKGYAGDPAYDAGTLLKTRALTILTIPDAGRRLHRTLDIFSEAAHLDRTRVGRWAQLHAVQTAFWGHHNGYRRGRAGQARTNLLTLVETLINHLTPPHPT